MWRFNLSRFLIISLEGRLMESKTLIKYGKNWEEAKEIKGTLIPRSGEKISLFVRSVNRGIT